MHPQRRAMLINAHRLGSAYGKLPSEILNRPNKYYQLDIAAYQVGSKQDKIDAEREAAKRSKR